MLHKGLIMSKSLISDFSTIIKLPNCALYTFKAAVVLFSVFLIATSQMLNIIIPIEKDAYELKLIVQKDVGKEFEKFNELPCTLKMKTYKECKMAQYQNNSANKGIELSNAIKKIIYACVFFLLLISIISFSFKIKGD